MSLTDKRIDRVARAICFAANVERYCPICNSDNRNSCIMLEQFRVEAETAIRAMKGY